MAAAKIGPLDQKTQDRFWKKVNKNGANGCWIWTARKDPDGYGRFGIKSLNSHSHSIRFAHRVAFTLERGEILGGLGLCHSCDNPPCCNPAHLFPGDQAANLRDASSKGRMPRGESSYLAKLTEEVVRKVAKEYAGGAIQADLAQRYGVTQSCISRAINGKRWAHLQGV